MSWIVWLCQALHLLEKVRKKRKENASKPWKLARRQYSGRVTLLLLSLHSAFLFAWRKDYLGCSKGTLLPSWQ